ncbi:uncharacterized protein BDR25DRAFT_267852 [Lindgomyces ingoldianus]|uniref:Uncharacterized protein n=1 Tax=Lindgomyces ingoldianus TaxID=673940 RepID=A0ACB6QLM4_9PLEO|nr:uncharacterized protein BDR25DRAFT_267852 [Lindgomyces ingoldianus]KAF2467046.1 hypothetical protein BDR25DRAFT_267852 [Lindgomyces ingoldianus]
MQRIINRAERATRTRIRRLDRLKAKERNLAEKQYRFQALQRENRWIRQELKTARQNLIEDWKLGPLRPNRAVGENKEKFGALEREQMGRPQLPNHMKFKEELLPFKPDDRVVVIRGPEKGKIGVIQRVNRDTNEVVVKDVNVSFVDGRAFDAFGNTPEARREAPLPLPFQDLKLVYKWENPRNGREEDIVVDSIRLEKRVEWDEDGNSREIVDPYTGKPRYDRYIAGTDIRIELTDEQMKKEEDPDYRSYECDTTIDIIEGPDSQTFNVPLVHPPMPYSVIDELRNKYGKTRTRHDPEFIEKIEAMERMEQEKKKLPEHMKTPMQVLREMKFAEKAAQPAPTLTPEMLERIGQIMKTKMPTPTLRKLQQEGKLREDNVA